VNTKRQREHEESEVAAEERIDRAERYRARVLEQSFPARARAQTGRERDERQDDGQEAPDDRLDHDASRQPELVFQLPQDIGASAPGGERQVPIKEHQHDHGDGGEERAPQLEGGEKDPGVADLLEPQPVGVEGNDLTHQAQGHEAQDQEQGGLRALHPGWD